MPVIIRRSCAADNNLPPAVGSTRIRPIRHTEGSLAGWTTIDAPVRVTRILRTGGWRAATGAEEIALAGEDLDATGETPEECTAWAADLVSGTVSELEEALEGLVREEHSTEQIGALRQSELDGKNRATALRAIDEWIETEEPA